MKEIVFPTRVVNCRRAPYDVYIGRGSKWGNPWTHLPLAGTLAEVEHDIQDAEMDIEDARGRLQELEDERVRVEDYEAEQRECLTCEGTGWIGCPDDVDPEEWDYDCPDCGGSGEVA